MGTFLALSAVVGASHKQVVDVLESYTKSVQGGIYPQEDINSDTDNCCIIQENEGNTSVFYPDGYLEWDDSSQFLSKELNATVFSFHIHDGDLWMYVLYNKGKIVDQFNPIPDYWEEDIAEDEVNAWRGNADTIAKYVPYVNPENIKNYLVRWDLETDEEVRAYPDDEFVQEDWQMTDFMAKLNLPYPVNDNGNYSGNTYIIWTKQLILKESPVGVPKSSHSSKPWWKFW